MSIEFSQVQGCVVTFFGRSSWEEAIQSHGYPCSLLNGELRRHKLSLPHDHDRHLQTDFMFIFWFLFYNVFLYIALFSFNQHLQKSLAVPGWSEGRHFSEASWGTAGLGMDNRRERGIKPLKTWKHVLFNENNIGNIHGNTLGIYAIYQNKLWISATWVFSQYDLWVV